MGSKPHEISKVDKILLYLQEVGDSGRAKLKIEEIVVGLYKKYPHDFHLLGYPEYPDSGGLIHKRLYDFKKKGYVNAAKSIFSITERGIEMAKKIKTGEADNLSDRLSRTAETEVSRIKSLEGFGLYIQHQEDKLSDSDFYSYLGVTVRTSPNSFIGRLQIIRAVMEDLKARPSDPLYHSLVSYHDFLESKYKDIISFFTKEV
jgi:DNA-binding PadR family transcriptional regulator